MKTPGHPFISIFRGIGAALVCCLLVSSSFAQSGSLEDKPYVPSASVVKGTIAALSDPSEEVVALVRKFGGFASAYLSHDQLLEEPQVHALDIIRDVPQSGGAVRTLDFPVQFSESRTVLRGDAPGLGEHNREIARELGVAADLESAPPAA